MARNHLFPVVIYVYITCVYIYIPISVSSIISSYPVDFLPCSLHQAMLGHHQLGMGQSYPPRTTSQWINAPATSHSPSRLPPWMCNLGNGVQPMYDITPCSTGNIYMYIYVYIYIRIPECHCQW
jgi:hypothetical protein